MERFKVVEKVRGKARPRVTRYRTFTPKETKAYESLVRGIYLSEIGKKFNGRVAVFVDVYRALPKSRPKKVESEPDTIKPDCDNIGKIVLDALNGVAYNDDGQVTCLLVVKHDRTRTDERIEVSIGEYSSIAVLAKMIISAFRGYLAQ